MDYVIEKSTLSSTVGKFKIKAFEKVARDNQPTVRTATANEVAQPTTYFRSYQIQLNMKQ
jgi:hypothetical protein